MTLPQYRQTLIMYPGDCRALAETAEHYVASLLARTQHGQSLRLLDALQLRPTTKLMQKFRRLAWNDHATDRKKVRKVNVEYDEMLVLNLMLQTVELPDWHVDSLRLAGHIDQKSLNLCPPFRRT